MPSPTFISNMPLPISIPNMSVNHFRYIASIISALPRDCTRQEVASAFSKALGQTNHTFHEQKFLTACQGFSEKVEYARD